MNATARSSIRRAVGVATLCLVLSGCNEAVSSGREGLKIVPVFGPDRRDVSEHLPWGGVQAGPIESERRFGADDILVGFQFSERLRADDDGLFPATEGEIGVSLNFENGNYVHHGRYVVPPAVDGSQRLEIPIDAALVELTIEGARAGETIAIGVDSPATGGTRVMQGGENYGRAWFLQPGRVTMSVGPENGDAVARQTFELEAGQRVEATLKLR